jgi:hypothetical protein
MYEHRSCRTASQESTPATEAAPPRDLQPWGNAEAAAALKSDPQAPTSYPGDVAQEEDPNALPDVYWEWDAGKWFSEKLWSGVVEKGLGKGFPGPGIVADAPLEAADDRNHPAEEHERQEREARAAFDASLAADEEEARRSLHDQRAAQQAEDLWSPIE